VLRRASLVVELLPSTVKAARALVKTDIETGVFLSKPMPPAVYDKAKQIARRRTPRLGTRSLDVLHVASALALQADTFYTFDRTQRKLANAEGLIVP
jgi:predicted nucleic acid-binding protein